MRRGTGRLLGLALAVLVAVGFAPAAFAQTEQPPLVPSEDPEGRWEGSAFTAPAEGTVFGEPELRVAGQFSYRKAAPGQRIIAATIEIAPDGFEPAPTCEIPPTRPVPGRPPHESDYDMRQPATLAFDESGFRLTCNGRYLAHATAQLEDGTMWSMQVPFGVEVAPPQVEQVTAEVDPAARAATITFTPLPLEARSADAAGYLVERSGPDDGPFTEVATIPDDAEPTAVDDLGAAEAGRYVYRVRPLRRGVDGPVPSDADAAPTAEVQLEGDPTTPTTAEPEAEERSVVKSTGRSRRGAARAVAPRRAPARATTPTTADTGFDDTLDYGDGAGGDQLSGDEPVAGQSIVQDEGEGMGLAVPAAGALVMLGWAGHILYLNRLARQL